MSQLEQKFTELGLDFQTLIKRIQDLVIKTILSIESQVYNNMNRLSKSPNVCFEIYGFDVIIDQKLKPWLLEVNFCPSLSSSSPLDKKIKTMMVSDSLQIIGLRPYDIHKLKREETKEKKARLLGIKKVEKPKSKVVDKDKKIDLGNLTRDEALILVDFEEESRR